MSAIHERIGRNFRCRPSEKRDALSQSLDKLTAVKLQNCSEFWQEKNGLSRFKKGLAIHHKSL
jgi:hypothetical protein